MVQKAIGYITGNRALIAHSDINAVFGCFGKMITKLEKGISALASETNRNLTAIESLKEVNRKNFSRMDEADKLIKNLKSFLR